MSEQPAIEKVDLPEQSYEKSNFLYNWFRLQRAIEDGEKKIASLDSELDAAKKALKENREKLLNFIKIEK